MCKCVCVCVCNNARNDAKLIGYCLFGCPSLFSKHFVVVVAVEAFASLTLELLANNNNNNNEKLALLLFARELCYIEIYRHQLECGRASASQELA